MPSFNSLREKISETIYEEFVKRKGYGLHHLGMKTEDIELSVNEMESKGFKVIQNGNTYRVKWAYLSTEPQVGLIFELLEEKKTVS